MTQSVELLTAHHLPYRVVNIIENAKEFVVLVTAYLQSWTHLTHAIKNTADRGVHVSLVMRAPDGAKRDREKRESEAKALQQMGVSVHFVERLHAKVYINERQAIVTSFNLVSGSNESIELGVLIEDPTLVADCIAKIRGYCPELQVRKTTGSQPQQHRIQPTRPQDPQAHCIGCAEPVPFDPTRPLCLSCYRSSKKGAKLDALPRRVCHTCCTDAPSTLLRPICPSCWKKLSKEEQAKITQALG